MKLFPRSVPVLLFCGSFISSVFCQEGTAPFTPPPPEPIREIPVDPVPEEAPGLPADTPAPTASPCPPALPAAAEAPARPAPVQAPELRLKGFADFPPKVTELVLEAFRLNDLNLAYTYGGADPARGGMDCSGTVFYLLRQLGWKNSPRQSDAFYRWVWESGHFVAVNGTTFDSYEWKKLRPGDLLFWTGTYAVSKDRDPAISHVMIYLGVDEKNGKRVMFGASEGRRYQDKTRSGVGLFDFSLPAASKADNGRQPRFIGYGRIPDAPGLKVPEVTNP